MINRRPSAWLRCQGVRLQRFKTPEGRQDVVRKLGIKSSFFDIWCEMLMTEIKVTTAAPGFSTFPPLFLVNSHVPLKEKWLELPIKDCCELISIDCN